MPVEFRPIDAPSTWKLFPRHPDGEDYEDLEPKLAKKMQEGIVAYGVMLRSVVLRREKRGLCVLDGWQIYQACIAVDYKPEFVELVGGIDPEKYVEIVNDFRRHEDRKARNKRLRIRKERSRELVNVNGKTVVDAAKELGVSERTVARDLAEAKVDKPPLPRCDRCERVNATGDECPRCQLLRMDSTAEDEPEEPEEKPKPPKKPPEPEPPAKPLLDANFVAVPEHVMEAFDVANELAHLCHDFDRLGKTLAKIVGHKVGARSISVTLPERIQDIRRHLWQARPTHVCAYCQGRAGTPECSACKGQGWQPGPAFAQAPKEMQDAMRQIGAQNVPI